MRTETNPRGVATEARRSRTRRTLVALVLMATGVCAFAAAAQAAVAPAPAWKVLALTGPTHLAPQQSEVQRVTVEAEGGTFSLAFPDSAKGEGTLNVVEGFAEVTEGSNQVYVWAPFGEFEVGQQVSGQFIPAGSTILAISGPSSEPTLELSSNPTGTSGFIQIKAASDEVTGVTLESGAFHAGDGIQGFGIQPGTKIVSVSGDTLKLSKYPTSGGPVSLSASEETSPIDHDADAAEVEDALQALAALGPGSVTVVGGPGGDAEDPYLLEFGGPLADEDINELTVDESALTGAGHFAQVFTTLPGGPGTGQISVNPANIGGAATSGKYTLTVGPLPAGIVTSGPPDAFGWNCSGGAGESTVTCTSTEPIKANGLSEELNLTIPIEVLPNAEPKASAPVEITGGGAAKPDSYEMPVVVSDQPAPPGSTAFWAGSFEADGTPSTQAGAHPYSAMTFFRLNTVRQASGRIAPAGEAHEAIVDLPPGFIGNPLATERCPQSNVICGTGTGPGTNNHASFGLISPVVSYFQNGAGPQNAFSNDIPPNGYAAEFSSILVVPIVSLLASVNSETDYGIRITSPNIPTFFKVFGSFVAFEGVPANGDGTPLLTNPVNCAETAERPPVVTGKFDTWQHPGEFSDPFIRTQPSLVGCDKLEFETEDPSTGEGQVGFSFQPSSDQGSAPVGAAVHLHIDQAGLLDADALATPELKRTVTKLPEGLSLNPSSANGLEACSEAQIGYLGNGFPMPNPMRFNEAAPACPDGSKLGTAEIKSPLLEAPLKGTVYLAAQEENPFGSLLAIYLVIDDARSGITLKLPGEVKADPTTGQLTAIFDNNPQLPFEDLTLNFRGGGPRSTLATPEVCGKYKTVGSLTPWSAPESGPPAQIDEAGFDVSSNCSASAGARPFSPSFEAGTTGTKAGAYSPLVIKVARKDGEQELKSLDFTLPKGLIGKLAGIPYCSEAQIAAAEAKTGKAEQANPSCPAASRIGSVDTAAGVGTEPIHVGGTVYLAGPYKGAPISAVVVTPGLAGPFDLGNVVIRTPLYIDPESAQLTAKSDPIPTILKGIPLKLRAVTINVDRPGLMLNPTSCEVKSATASIAGNSGATATPSNRFQVGGCGDLKFTPKLKLSLKGGIRRNGHPALTAVLTQPPGQANIGRVSVALPHSEFLEQSHIRTICTRVQFAAHACPRGAVYGEAEAITPLLDQPLKGPVYLRSSSNKLPDLVVALRGPDSQPVEVALVGRIDSVNGGIRNSFELVPDAPVSKFVLRMQGGKKGLLVNSTNICHGKHRAAVKMAGQNGRLHNFKAPLHASCRKSSKHKKHKRA